jgi:hypothetical protein
MSVNFDFLRPDVDNPESLGKQACSPQSAPLPGMPSEAANLRERLYRQLSQENS